MSEIRVSRDARGGIRPELYRALVIDDRDFSYYWLRVFRLIGLACKVLGLLILGAIA